VFVPVDSYSGTVIDKKKQQLREKLDRIDEANKIEHIPVPA
jgi:hypothetical protein